jgi:hypothetical protein
MTPTVPSEVKRLIGEIRAEVTQAYGVEPDLTPETLPLIDQYLRDVATGLPQEQRELKVAAAGAYFGEVVRKKLNARWAAIPDGPPGWRIELGSCFLHFRPVGMAAEALAGCETEEHDGTFATLDELHDDLFQMLEQAPAIPEDEYYSLSGRLEILSLVADWLVGRRLAHHRPRKPPAYSAEDYQRHLAGGPTTLVDD